MCVLILRWMELTSDLGDCISCSLEALQRQLFPQPLVLHFLLVPLILVMWMDVNKLAFHTRALQLSGALKASCRV